MNLAAGVTAWGQLVLPRMINLAGVHPVALARHGYEKARRIGVMAMVGGKNKTAIRNATPIPFRDLLILIARTAGRKREAA